MKTIEITSGTQKAQFTTKSVTFDNKEFLYANMGDVMNDAVECVYTFIYDGELKKLPYEQKDAKVLNAIFSQVQNLKTAKKTPAETAAAKAPSQKEASPPAAEAKEASDKTTPATEQSQTASAQEDGVPADAPDAKVQAADPSEGTSSDAAVSAKQEDAKTADAEQNDKAGSAGAPEALAGESENAAADTKKEKLLKMPADPEKQTQFKKSIKIFGIVLAAIIAISIIYYFMGGADNEPAPSNPNTTESQQYEDIDQLIEDLQ